INKKTNFDGGYVKPHKNHRQEMVTYFQKMSFILPAITLLLLLTAYPLYQVIQMSFYNYSDKANPVFSGLNNYFNFIVDPLFWNALKNTIIFTFTSVFFGLIIGLTFALLLNQPINTKFRALFRSILIFPWLTSSTV